MKIIKYGITLRRIVEEDIEFLRQKRNAISPYMEFREYISPEMQKAWFNSINNYDNFYYIIEFRGTKIGLIHENEIDREKGWLNSGMFLFDIQYYNSYIPVLASLILIENSYYYHRNDRDSYIKIMKNNAGSIRYNEALGYVKCPDQEDKENQSYVLKKENFEKKAIKLRRAALSLCDDNKHITLILEKHDFISGLAQQYLPALDAIKKNTLWPLKIYKSYNTLIYYAFEDSKYPLS
jgi:hypothetical protein